MLEPNPPGTTPGSPKTNEDDVELISDYSWRNFFSVINFVHILQKLTKRKTHRVLLLVQYKSSVRHYTLSATFSLMLVPAGYSQTDPQSISSDTSALRSQGHQKSSPVLRSEVATMYVFFPLIFATAADSSEILANMKVITAIYLHCRPDLRDEWLTGIDVDADVEDSLVCRFTSKFFWSEADDFLLSLKSKHFVPSFDSSTRSITAPMLPSSIDDPRAELVPPAISILLLLSRPAVGPAQLRTTSSRLPDP